jgi:MYXO-CTERM domain-containing protein
MFKQWLAVVARGASSGGRIMFTGMFSRALIAALASVALASPVAAVMLDFTVTSLKGTDFTASWQLPQDPVPDSVFLSNQFAFADVSFLINGNPETHQIAFFRAGGIDKGGLMIGTTTAAVVLVDGMQLYTGELASPTFLIGTFELDGYTLEGILPYRVTISEATEVSEPAGLAVMLAGLGLLGVVRRRRETVAAT